MIETVDLPERIREVAFARLLASGDPVAVQTISSDLGTSAAAVEAAIGTLVAAADDGRQRWAGCARAAQRLGQTE